MVLDQYFRPFRDSLDSITRIENTLEFLVLVWIIAVVHQWITSPKPSMPPKDDNNEDEEPDPPRNFTMEQLKYFDGTKEEGKKGQLSDVDKPVYLSVNGTVFDVSDGRDFYGPEGPYSNFAGHECGVALAKMSFDVEHLDDLDGIEALSPSEKTELEGWIEKFTYYRPYPIKGRLVADSTLAALKDRELTKEDIADKNGVKNAEDIPKGYATAPIYLGAGEHVYDVSFGGVEFYGEKGGYHRFAGKDASRALAKMSFEPEDVINTSIDDLEEKQKKVLDDWVKTFRDRKKYPVVGKLKK